MAQLRATREIAHLVILNSTKLASKLGYPTYGPGVRPRRPRDGWRASDLKDGAVLLRLRHKDGQPHLLGRIIEHVGLDDGLVPKRALDRNLVLADLDRGRHNLGKHLPPG